VIVPIIAAYRRSTLVNSEGEVLGTWPISIRGSTAEIGERVGVDCHDHVVERVWR